MRSPTTRCTRRLAAAVAALLLAGAAGCGDDGADVPTSPPTTAAPTSTTSTTSTVPPAAGPGPVRVIGGNGEHGMVGYGGCWTDGGVQVCGDPVWPSCPDPSLPGIPAAAGATLTFVLPVEEVTSLTLTTGDGSTVIDLDPAPRADWDVVTPDGPIVLRAEVPGRGDPAWAACLLPAR
jgi:hypothetical protein